MSHLNDINGTNYETYFTVETQGSNYAVTLNSKALENATEQIKLTTTDTGSNYTLNIAGTLTQEAFTVDTAATFTNGQLTTPSYKAWYKVADNVITPHDAIEGKTFNFTFGTQNFAGIKLVPPAVIDENAPSIAYTIQSNDGINYGTLTATVSDGAITNYAFVVNQKFLTAAGNISLTGSEGVDFSLKVDSTVTTEGGGKGAEFDATTKTYTAAVTGAAHYEVDTVNKKITFVEQGGGEKFTLNGNLSNGITAENFADYFTVSGNNVYLKASAFTGDNATITLINVNDASYQLAAGGEGLDTVTDTPKSFTGTGTYTYTAASTTEGVTLDGTTSATYRKAKGGCKFTIEGLASNLVVYKGNIYAANEEVFTTTDGVTTLKDDVTDVPAATTALATISGNTVTLNSLDILAGGGNSDVTFKLTDLNRTGDYGDTEINYTLEFDSAFNKKDKAPENDHAATFAISGGTGNYTSAYTSAYTIADSNGGYTYHKETTPTTFKISGLKTEDVASTTDLANYISVDNKVITLNEGALPAAGTMTTAIVVPKGYTLGTLPTDLTTAQTVAATFDGTIFTTTGSSAYYNANGTVQAEVTGKRFTFSKAISGTFNAETSGDTTTVKDGSGNTLFTVSKSGDNYAFTINQAFITTAGDAEFNITSTDSANFSLALGDAASAKVGGDPASFSYASGTLTYKDAVDEKIKYTLSTGAETANTNQKTVSVATADDASTLFTISGLNSDLSGTVTIDADGKITVNGTAIGEINGTEVTLYRSALPNTPTTVTLSDNDTTDEKNYTLKIKDAVTAKPTADTYEFVYDSTNSKAIYRIAAKPEYWTHENGSTTWTYGGAETAAVTQFELNGELGTAITGNDKVFAVKGNVIYSYDSEADTTDDTKGKAIALINSVTIPIHTSTYNEETGKFDEADITKTTNYLFVTANAFNGDDSTINITSDKDYIFISNTNPDTDSPYLEGYGHSYNVTAPIATVSGGTITYTPLQKKRGVTSNDVNATHSGVGQFYANSLTYHAADATEPTAITVSGLNASLTTADVLPYIEISSLDQLLSYVDDNGSLKSGNYVLTENIDYGNLSSLQIKNANVAIDLNGKTLSGTTPIELREGGNLTINDSSTDKSGKITNSSENGFAIFFYGGTGTANLTVNGGTITGGKGTYGAGVYVSRDGNLTDANITVNGGTITGGTGIKFYKGGNLVVNDGTITGTTGIELHEGGLYVNDGNITATASSGYSILNVGEPYNRVDTYGAGIAVTPIASSSNAPSVNITGGNISGYAALAVVDLDSDNSPTPAVNITGGIFTAKTDGTTAVDSSVGTSNIALQQAAVYNADTDVTANITGGTFVGGIAASDDNNNAFAVLTVDGATVAKFGDSAESAATKTTTELGSMTGATESTTPVTVTPPTTPATAPAVIIGEDTIILGAAALDNTTAPTLPTGYTLKLGSDVNTKPYVINNAGSFRVDTDKKIFTFTAPTYKAYYDSDGKYHAATTAESFTFTLGTASSNPFDANKFSVLTNGLTSKLIYDGNTYATFKATDEGNDGTIDSRAFTVTKNFLDEIAADNTLTLGTPSGITATLGIDSKADVDTSASEATTAATFTKNGDAYDYKTSSTSDYFDVATTPGTITHVAAVGSSDAVAFTLKGLSNTFDNATFTVTNEGVIQTDVVAEGETATVIGKVAEGKVYLTKDAFNTSGDNKTITISGTDYELATVDATDTTYLKAFALGETKTDNGKITVAAEEEGVIRGENSLTYQPETEATTIKLTGVVSDATATPLAGGTQAINLTTDNLNNYVVNGVLQSGYYKLNGDITLNSALKVNSNVILDLNGHTLKTTASGTEVIHVQKEGNLTVNDSVTGGKIVSEQDWGIYVRPTNEEGAAWNDNDPPLARLTINDGTIQGKLCGVGGNGNGHGTYIVINGGTIENTNNATQTDKNKENCAIYHPQNGTLIINGGTIKGYDSGVEMRSGTLYVTGGAISSMASTTTVKENGNGATTVGAALAIAQHTTDKAINANITGGTFSGHTALSITNPNNRNSSNTLAVNVTGGTFTSTNNDNGNAVYSSDSRVTTAIGGGTFKGKIATAENASISITNGVEYTAANGASITATDTVPTITASATGSIVINDKVITLHRGALSTTGNTTVTTTSYTIALGDDVPVLLDTDSDGTVDTPPELRGASLVIANDNKSATYTGTAYGEYFTLQNDSKTVKHFNATGGGVITISGLDGVTLAPADGDTPAETIDKYVNTTNIVVTQADGTLTDGQYAAGNYTVTVGKDLLKQLGVGKNLTFGTDTTDGANFSVQFNSDEFNAADVTADTYDSNKLLAKELNADAKLSDTETAGQFTYTAAVENFAYYELTNGADTASKSNKEIAFHAQKGGEKFEISGLYVPDDYKLTVDGDKIVARKENKSDITLATIGTKTAVEGQEGKYTVAVTLTEAAFKLDGYTDGSKPTVTLKDSDSSDAVNYALSLGTGEGALYPYSSTADDITETFTGADVDGVYTYTYQAKGKQAGYELDKNSGEGYTSKITYTAQTGGQTFTVTGLKDGLNIDSTGKLYATADTNQISLGTLTNNKLTITSTDALADLTDGKVTVTLTDGDKDFGVDSTNNRTFSLATPATTTPFNYGTTAPATSTAATLTETTTGGTYTYKAVGYKNAYSYGDTNNNTFTYVGATTDLQFDISGLKAGQTFTAEQIGKITVTTADGKITKVKLSSYDLLPDTITAGDSTATPPVTATTITVTPANSANTIALELDDSVFKPGKVKDHATYSGGVFTAPTYQPVFEVSGNTATCKAASFGGNAYFKLEGFNELTFDNTDFNADGYAIKFNNNVIGRFKATLNDDKTVITSYDFSFTDKSALNLTLGDNVNSKTISVKQYSDDDCNMEVTGELMLATLDLSGISDLIIIGADDNPPAAGNTGTWKKDKAPNYYVYTIGADTFYARKGSTANTYTYNKKSSTKPETTYYVKLANWNLRTDNTGDGNADKDYIGEYVTVDATDPNNPVAIFSKAAVETNGILLTNEENLIVSDDDGFKGILSDEAKAVNHTPAQLEPQTNGVYQFVTEKIKPGFVETADGAVWYWDGTAKTLGGTTFTANQYGGIAEFEISGLIDGVKTYYNKKLNRYEVYKVDDFNTDGTVKANATLLLTIDANRTKYTTTGTDNVITKGTEVTIHSLEAFKNFTELGQTAEGGEVSITVTDLKAQNDAAFILKYDRSLEQYFQSSAQTGDVAESFNEDGNTGTYTYRPKITGWHFEKTDATTTATTAQFSSSLTYKPTAQDANNPPQFTITGLKSGLKGLKIVASTDTNYPYQIQTGDGTVIGRIGKKGSNLSDGVQIYLKEAAMPTNQDGSPAANTSVSIAGKNCELGLWMSSTSLTTHADGNTLTRSGANYTYTASGDSAGYELNDEGKIVYVPQNGGQQFRFSGLYRPEGTLIGLDEDGNIVRATVANTDKGIDDTDYNALTDSKDNYVYSGGLYYNATEKTVIATVEKNSEGKPTGQVTLKAVAFNTGATANDQTITFEDLKPNDGIKYTVTFDNNSTVGDKEIYISESFNYTAAVAASGTEGEAGYTAAKPAYYTYQASGTMPYFTDTISNDGKVKYVAQTDGQKFTITGLKDGLVVFNDNIYAEDSAVFTTDANGVTTLVSGVTEVPDTAKSLGTLSKVGSTTTVTLNNTSVLGTVEPGGNVNITLNDLTDNTGNEQTYKLAFGNDFHNWTAETVAAKFEAADNTATTYTYTAAHKGAYTEETTPEGNSYVYHAEAAADTVTISGLVAGQTIDITKANKYVSYADGTFTLKKDILPTTGGDITLTATYPTGTAEADKTAYKLAVDGVKKTAFQSDDNGTLENGKYSTPAFDAYYELATTGDDANKKITAHAETDAQELFTIGGLSSLVTTGNSGNKGEFSLAYDASTNNTTTISFKYVTGKINGTDVYETIDVGTIKFTEGNGNTVSKATVTLDGDMLNDVLVNALGDGAAATFNLTNAENQTGTFNLTLDKITDFKTAAEDDTTDNPAHWSNITPGKATFYAVGKKAFWSNGTNNGTYTYTNKKAGDALIEVSGLTADATLTASMVDQTKHELTLSKDFLPKTTTPLTLTNLNSNNYSLAIEDAEPNRVFTDANADGVKTAATFAAVENKTGEYTYTAEYTKDYYILKDNSVTFTAGDESTAKTTFTVTGLKSYTLKDGTSWTIAADGTITGTITENDTNKTVTLGTISSTTSTTGEGADAVTTTTTFTVLPNALNGTDITLTDAVPTDKVNYVLALGEHVDQLIETTTNDGTIKHPPIKTAAGFGEIASGATSATYQAAEYNPYYTLGTKDASTGTQTATYHAATGGETFTVNLTNVSGVTEITDSYITVSATEGFATAGDSSTDYQVTGYTFTVKKALLDKLTDDGKALTFAKGADVTTDFTLEFDRNETYSDSNKNGFRTKYASADAVNNYDDIENGNFTYTAKIQNYAYYEKNDTSITYHAQQGGKSFTLTGLDKTLTNITVNESTGVITATKGGQSVPIGKVDGKNIYLTANAFADANATSTISIETTDSFTLEAYTGSEEGYLKAFSTNDDNAATFVKSGNNYVYTASSKNAGVTGSGTSITYKPKEGGESVTISGANFGTDTFTVDPAKDATGDITIKTTSGSTTTIYATITKDGAIKLKEAALPSDFGSDATKTISLSDNNDNFTLALDDSDTAIVTTQWTVDDATDKAASFDGTKFKAPTYKAYFTDNSDSTITGYKSIGGDTITFTLTNVDTRTGTASCNNSDTTTVDELFDVKAAVDNNGNVTYTVTAKENFVKSIKQGGSISISGATFDTTLPTVETDVQVNANATFAQDTTDTTKYVYTAAITQADEYKFAEGSTTKIEHTLQKGGQKFTLSGDGMSEGLKDTSDSDYDFSKYFTVSGASVYLKADAFAPDENEDDENLPTITLGNDGQGEEFAFAYGNGSDGALQSEAEEIEADFSEASNSGTYTYTNAGTNAYISIDDDTSATYTAKVGFEKFNISGLSSGLAMNDSGEIYEGSESTDKDTGETTLVADENSTLLGKILALEGTVEVSLSDAAILGEVGYGATHAITFKAVGEDELTFDVTFEGDLDYSEAYTAELVEEGEEANVPHADAVLGSDGTYTGEHIPSYVYGSDSSYNYRREDNPANYANFKISGISLPEENITIDGTIYKADDYVKVESATEGDKTIYTVKLGEKILKTPNAGDVISIAAAEGNTLTYALTNPIPIVTNEAEGFYANNSVFDYKSASFKAGYEPTSDGSTTSYTYKAASGGDTLFTLTGLTTLEGKTLKVDASTKEIYYEVTEGEGESAKTTQTVIGTLDGKAVTLNSNALPTSGTVALTGEDYTLSLLAKEQTNGVNQAATADPAHWNTPAKADGSEVFSAAYIAARDNTVAYWGATKNGTETVANSYTLVEAEKETTLFTLSGLKDNTALSVTPEEIKSGDTVMGYKVTIGADKLNAGDVSIGTGNTLVITATEDVKVGTTVSDADAVVEADLSGTGGNFTYTSTYDKAYFVGNKDGASSYTYTASTESTNKHTFKINGLNAITDDPVSGTNIDTYLTISGNTVTVNAAAIDSSNAPATIALTEGGTTYTALALNSDIHQLDNNKVPPTASEATFGAISDGKATYTAQAYKDYYTVDGLTAKHFAASGGETFEITLMGVNDITALDNIYITVAQSGAVNETEGSATKGQYQISGYTFKVTAALLDKMSDVGDKVSFANTSDAEHYQTAPTVAYDDSLADTYKTAVNGETTSATLTKIGNDYVYTAKIDTLEYFKNENGTIEHMPQIGGTTFTIKGLYVPEGTTLTLSGNNIVRSSDSKTLATIDTDGKVTLTADAFDPNATTAQTIELVDGNNTHIKDEITYVLDKTGLTGDGSAINETLETVSSDYQYTASGTNAKYELTDSDSKLTYTPQTGGQKFTITGLKDGLNLTTFKAVATISGNNVTLNNVSILPSTTTAGDKDATITLTNVNRMGAYSYSDSDINFTLGISTAEGNGFNKVDSEPEDTAGNTFTATTVDNDGKATYTPAHKPAYTIAGDTANTFNYKAEETPATVDITGLVAGANTSLITYSDKVFTLDEGILPDANGTITVSDTTNYKLKVADGVAKAAYQVAADGNGGTFSGGKYTAPNFRKYVTYTGDSATSITTHASTTGAELFSINDLGDYSTVTYDNTSMTATIEGLGTVKFAADGYTVDVQGSTLKTIAGNAFSKAFTLTPVGTTNITFTVTEVAAQTAVQNRTQSWGAVADNKATFTNGALAAYWLHNDTAPKTYTYYKALESESVTVSGLKSDATLNANMVSGDAETGYIVTIPTTALNAVDGATYKFDGTVPTGYTLVITENDNNVTASEPKETAATYTDGKYTSNYIDPTFYKASDNNYGYRNIDKYEFALSGNGLNTLTLGTNKTQLVNDSTVAATFDRDAKTVYIYAAAVKEADGSDIELTNATEGLKLAIGTGSDNVLCTEANTVKTAAGWKENAPTTYATMLYHDYYTQSGDTKLAYTAEVGGEQITVNGVSVNSGITVSNSGTAYTITVSKDVLDAMTAGAEGKLSTTITQNDKTSDTVTATFAVTDTTVLQNLTGDAVNDAAKFDGGNGTFTYTAAGTKEFYNVGNEIERVAATGHQQFTISRLDSSITALTLNGNDIYADSTKLGTVTISGDNGTVTLTANAFKNYGDAITVTDGNADDGITFSLAQGDLTTAEQAKIDVSFENTEEAPNVYTYTASGMGNHYALSGNTLTYTAQTGGEQFTVNGLKNNLTLAAVGTLTDKTFTITKPDALNDGTFSFSSDKADDTDVYTFALGDDFKYLGDDVTEPTMTGNVLSTESATSTAYTYNGSHKPIYTVKNGDNYTYHAEETTGFAKFTLTGLKAGLISDGTTTTLTDETLIKVESATADDKTTYTVTLGASAFNSDNGTITLADADSDNSTSYELAALAARETTAARFVSTTAEGVPRPPRSNTRAATRTQAMNSTTLRHLTSIIPIRPKKFSSQSAGSRVT